MTDKVRIGDEVETQNGTKVYVTYIQHSDRDECEWYQGVDTNGRVHVAIKELLCHKTGKHSATIAKWLLNENKGELKMERLTYKSRCGDYGSNKTYDTPWDEIQALRNRVGEYEDLDLTPEEIKRMLFSKKEDKQ